MKIKNAMKIVCQDFSTFCSYLVKNKSKLSKTTNCIGKKDCFELNALFSMKESYEKATRFQKQYPIIQFFHYVALKYRILEIDYKTMFLYEGRNYKNFMESSEVEKYVFFIVNAFYDMGFLEQEVTTKMNVFQLIKWLFENKAHTDEEYQLKNNEFLWLVYDMSKITSILEEFCLVKILEKPLYEKGSWKGTLKIKILHLFEMVAEGWKEVLEDEISIWDIDVYRCVEIYLKVFVPKCEKSNLFCLLQPAYEVNLLQAVDLKVKIRHTDVVRVIRINLSDSLYSLHKMIQKAVNFDDDHLFEFYVGQGVLAQTYTISETTALSEGKDVRDTTLGELELYEGMKFSYLFDFGDMWWFDIEVLDILDFVVNEPKVIKEVNLAPEQYPCCDELW